jgi:hypothetical protein
MPVELAAVKEVVMQHALDKQKRHYGQDDYK